MLRNTYILSRLACTIFQCCNLKGISSAKVISILCAGGILHAVDTERLTEPKYVGLTESTTKELQAISSAKRVSNREAQKREEVLLPRKAGFASLGCAIKYIKTFEFKEK